MVYNTAKCNDSDINHVLIERENKRSENGDLSRVQSATVNFSAEGELMGFVIATALAMRSLE